MTDLPNDTRMALGEITATQRYLVKTLDGVVAGFGDFRKEMKTEQDAIVVRLTKLEQFQWKLLGAGFLVSFTMPLVTLYIKSLL